MFLLFICFIISFRLVLVLKLVNYLVSESSIFNREELSAFECGFDTHRLSRIPFSIRYFFMTLVFLLFDLEIILLVFSPRFFFLPDSFFRFFLILFFISILLLSLFYELLDGTLD